MFRRKYTVSVLNSKWEPLKRNVNFHIIPRRDELIYMDEKYYTVLNVVHMNNKIQDIFIIVDELVQTKESEIQSNIK